MRSATHAIAFAQMRRAVCQRQLSLLFGDRKMWPCSQTRCRSYLYSPTIVISFWDFIVFLFFNVGIR